MKFESAPYMRGGTLARNFNTIQFGVCKCGATVNAAHSIDKGMRATHEGLNFSANALCASRRARIRTHARTHARTPVLKSCLSKLKQQILLQNKRQREKSGVDSDRI